MTDPTDKLPKDKMGLTQSIMATAKINLEERFDTSESHIRGAKIAKKIRSVLWWIPCAIGLYVDYLITMKGTPSVTTLAVPTFVSIFSAFKADPEGTKAVLNSIFTAGKKAREIAKGEDKSTE